MFKEEEENLIVIDDEETAEFIQERLLAEGVVVTKEDIMRILYYQFEYMGAMGVVDYLEEE